MIFQRKKPEIPRVENLPRLSRAELSAILDQPNGAGILRAQRTWCEEFSKQQALAIADIEKSLEFTRALKANSDAVMADINNLLGEVPA